MNYVPTPASQTRSVVLTGDRPTGPLHLGHFKGSLQSRLNLQDLHDTYVLVADLQALTDNASDPGKVTRNVVEVAMDYLAVGIDPAKTTICVQSCLPALHELSMLYMNLVTVARLERNPTVKEEIRLRGMARDIPCGFLAYPVSQAADITAFRATLVPVGDDQVPMIEQTNEIVRRVNRLTGADVLPEAQALLSKVGRLPGIDGKSKMSKSQGNSISLGASADEIKAAVRMMYTDSTHLRAEDPGQVEGNVVFTYLDAFDPDLVEVATLKERYKQGGLGDSVIKRRLEEVLQEFLRPIRTRRQELARDRGYVIDVLRAGTDRASQLTHQTLADVRSAMGLFSFSDALEVERAAKVAANRPQAASAASTALGLR